jgi:hypothetical protein
MALQVDTIQDVILQWLKNTFLIIIQRHGYQGESTLETINDVPHRVKKYSKYVFHRVLRLSGP